MEGEVLGDTDICDEVTNWWIFSPLLHPTRSLPSQLVSIAPWDSVVPIQIDREIQNKTKEAANCYRASGWRMLSNACFASKITSVFKESGGREEGNGSGKFMQCWAQPIGLIFVFWCLLLISKTGFTFNLIKGSVWLVRITFDFGFARIEWRLLQGKFTKHPPQERKVCPYSIYRICKYKKFVLFKDLNSQALGCHCRASCL